MDGFWIREDLVRDEWARPLCKKTIILLAIEILEKVLTVRCPRLLDFLAVSVFESSFSSSVSRSISESEEDFALFSDSSLEDWAEALESKGP